MKKIISYIFIGIGVIDFACSLIGIDFYLDFFGIYLTGFLYEYSPFIAGLIGLVFWQLSRQEVKEEQILTDIDIDETVVFQTNCRVKQGSFWKPEFLFGVLFITEKRFGFKVVSIQTGQDVIDSDGSQDFLSNLDEIYNVKKKDGIFIIKYTINFSNTKFEFDLNKKQSAEIDKFLIKN